MFNSLLQVEKNTCLCFCWYFAWRLIFSSPPDLHKNKFIWKKLTVTRCVGLSFLKGIGNGWGLSNILVWGQCAFWVLPCQIPSWSLLRWRETAYMTDSASSRFSNWYTQYWFDLVLISIGLSRVRIQPFFFKKNPTITTANKRPWYCSLKKNEALLCLK